MKKKSEHHNLLEPESAVENYLDTLLQEATEAENLVQPLKLKKTISLVPENTLQVTENIEPPEPANIEQPGVSATPVVDVHKQDNPALRSRSLDYAYPIQCLMFKVENNLLSIPLLDMGSVQPWDNNMTQLPRAAAGFLGLMKYRERNVKVMDTATILDIKQTSSSSQPKHILVFGDEEWAITCDQLGEVVYIESEDIHWSKPDAKSLALGTIKQSLALILDPRKVLQSLGNLHIN